MNRYILLIGLGLLIGTVGWAAPYTYGQNPKTGQYDHPGLTNLPITTSTAPKNVYQPVKKAKGLKTRKGGKKK
jgi:hypothetical protein